jgi:exosortase A
MSAVTNPVERDSRAYAVWVACGVAAFVALAFHDAFAGLATVWAGQHTYSHGFLTAPLIFVLIWRQRERIFVEHDPPVVVAATLLLAVAVCTAMASLAAITLATYVLIPAIAWLAVLGVLGRRAAAVTLLPIGMLYFCMPIWGPLAGPLQMITAWASGGVVRLIGIPALVEDNLITVPVGSFEVAGGCSGLNFFVVSVTLATLYGHLQAWSWARRAVLLVTAMVFAMVANWLRVIVVIVAATVTNGHTALVRDHYSFGWGLFAACLVVLMLLARRLDRSATIEPPSALAVPTAPGRAALLRRSALIGSFVLAGPAWATVVTAWSPDPRAAASPLPPSVPGWRGPVQSATGWAPVYPGAAFAELGAYTGPLGVVELFRVAYTRESRGQKMLGEDSRLEGTAGWRVVSDRMGANPGPAGRWALRERIATAPDGQEWLIAYWYEVDGVKIVDPRQVKLREGLRAFRGPGIARLSAVAVRCVVSCTSETSWQPIADFVAALPVEVGPMAVVR